MLGSITSRVATQLARKNPKTFQEQQEKYQEHIFEVILVLNSLLCQFSLDCTDNKEL